MNLLNLYWQPGITDIQQSRYFFQTEMVEKEVLKQRYPHLEQGLRSTGAFSSRFLYDDPVSTADYATVIEVYYHKHQQGRQVLHYCRFVGDQVLFATENETEEREHGANLAQTGLYAHGKFPYVLDPLFPIEGSPCGYGYVDLCRNPQTEIDLMKTSFIKNAMVGAIPRYLVRENGNVKAEDLLDLSRPLVAVSGSLDEMAFRRIEHPELGDTEPETGDGGEILDQFFAFQCAFRMAGIDRHQKDGITPQHSHRVFHGGEGGFPHGGQGFVAAAWHISQIEHACLDGLVYKFRRTVVRRADKSVILGASLRLEGSLRADQCLGLNIKGGHTARGANGFGEECGIVAVAHREIHRHVSLAEMGEDEIFLQCKQIYHI